MDTEFRLSYTGQEINERLGKIDKAVLYTRQSLTEEQKTQARENIGINDDEIKKYIDERISKALEVIENGTY